jgi:hypothetical protein
MRVPTLQIVDLMTKRVTREATTNAEKSAMFFEAFFPKKPMATSVPDNYEYPPPKWKFTNVTDAQIYCLIRKMKPYKGQCRAQSQTVSSSTRATSSSLTWGHFFGRQTH